MNFNHALPDDFDYDDFDDENEDISNDSFMQAFRMTPKGPVPVNPKMIMNMMRHKITNVGSICNGEFVIYLVERIDIGDNAILLLECEINPDYRGKRTFNIFQAYEYLNTTHYLNLLVTKICEKSVWAFEAIDMQIHINEDADKSNNNYSKILIKINTSSAPECMYDVILCGDVQLKSYDEMSTKIANTSMMLHIIKSKSFYAPVVHYDLSFALNSGDKFDFESMHLANFYNYILKEYIQDAIYTFYPNYDQVYPLDEIGDKLLRIEFTYLCTPKLLAIQMMCAPSMIDNDKLYKYNFDMGHHTISEKSFAEYNHTFERNLITFINQTSSSEVSQLVTLNTFNHGIRNFGYEEYTIMSSRDILFTLNRNVRNTDHFMINGKRYIYENTKEYPSTQDFIYSYWKASERVSVPVDNDKIEVFGFINFNKNHVNGRSFNDIYQLISDELNNLFNISSEIFHSDTFRFTDCYEDENIVRFILFRTNYAQEDNVVPTNNKGSKKKFRLFGGD